MTNVYNGQTYITTYPFGPYVYYQPWSPDSSIIHGYNPSNSTCYYDTTVPPHQPDWCGSYWGPWDVVGCDSHYSITSLSIIGNSWTKTAKIPTAIGVLTSLQYLRLNNMGLSGSIPNLMSLSRLSYLDLENNMLTGSVPDFVTSVLLWSYPKLDYNCNLTSSVPTISNHSRVGICSDDRRTIAAEGQAICKIARAWSSVRINVYNGNTYVPKPVFSNSYGGDTSLRYGYNPANSTCYYNTSMPLHQPVWCNYWSGISCTNNKVTSLQIQNPIETNRAKIPTAIGALTNLQYLDLSYAGLSGSIPNLIGLSELQSLYLYNNRLTGAVPAFINTMTTRPNTNVDLRSNCNLTWTSTRPMGINSYAVYQSQGSCTPPVSLKPGQLVQSSFVISKADF